MAILATTQINKQSPDFAEFKVGADDEDVRPSWNYYYFGNYQDYFNFINSL